MTRAQKNTFPRDREGTRRYWAARGIPPPSYNDLPPLKGALILAVLTGFPKGKGHLGRMPVAGGAIGGAIRPNIAPPSDTHRLTAPQFSGLLPRARR